MAELYHVLPSEVMSIADEYIAYCFNEACAYIHQQIKMGKERVKTTQKVAVQKRYSNFFSMYKDILGR